MDLDALLRDVELEGLVQRSGVPDIVAQSTSRVAGSALDLARRQLAGLDAVTRHYAGAVSGAGFLIRANATCDSAELPRTTRGELFNSSPTATDRRDSEGMQS